MFLRQIFLSVFVCVLAAAVAFASQAERLEPVVLAQIREAYKNLCETCRIEFKQLHIPEVRFNSAEDVKVITDGVAWAGSFLLPLEVSGTRAGWVSGQVKISQQGLVARRALQSGENLTAEDVEKDWIDVTFMKDQLAQVSDFARLAPKKFIGARQPLMMSDLRKIFVVQRGQTVKISLGGDAGFEITTSMRAEDNGAIGDLIRVKNLETQKILSVRVEKEGSARVE